MIFQIFNSYYAHRLYLYLSRTVLACLSRSTVVLVFPPQAFNKTPVSEPDRIPGRAMNVVLPPGFACPSRDKPHRVPPYSGAITGAPVRSLLQPTVSISLRSDQRLRGHVRLSAPPASTLSGSLFVTSQRTLPVTAFNNDSICMQVSHICDHLST